MNTERKVQYTDDRTKQLASEDKIGNVWARIELKFLDDRFSGVVLLFEPEDFDLLDSAFRAKYGKPGLADTVPLNNALGATYMNQRRAWKFNDVDIIRGGKYLDAKTSFAGIGKRALTRYEEAEQKRKKNKAAKDL